MWMVVMFDLPVMEKAERKAATQFRNGLLDLGFEMSQFSVYMRFCTSQAQVDTLCRAVERALPGRQSEYLPIHRQTVRTRHHLPRAQQTAGTKSTGSIRPLLANGAVF